jgi:hypothetical protein
MSTSKAPRAARTVPRETPKGARALLRVTDIPGVFLNRDGVQVDEHGVLLSIGQAKAREAALRADLGTPVETPAEYLRRLAMDPRQPQDLRFRAAIAAAPYFDRKMPQAIEGGDGPPIRTESSSVLLSRLQALSPDDRRAALATLEALGVLE